MKKSLAHTLLLSALCFSTVTFASNASEQKSLKGLVARVAPALEGRVVFDVDASEKVITIKPTQQGKFKITAPNQSSAAAGLGCYLREVANAHWSWCGSRLDVEMPTPTKTLTYTPAYDYMVAYNFCTLSYTMANWDKEQWTAELDRLALYGFNMPLVQLGIPKVWTLTLRELGYPEERIRAFLPDDASAAWWNMGNLEGLGGPLTKAEVEKNAEMGRWLVQEMKRRGMKPILLGFTGLVPHDLGKYLTPSEYEDAHLVDQGHWCDGFKRPAVLAPTSKSFEKIARIYYKHLKAVYGIDTVDAFAGDLFHEGGRTGGLNVTECARAVQAAQQETSPGAIWVVQAWHNNPTPALLKGLDPKLSIIEALVGDQKDGHHYQRNFHGIPWVWCELVNFGGNHGLYGGFPMLANLGELTKTPNFETMKGFGLLSEGLETNPLIYELFTERFFYPMDKVMTKDEQTAWLSRYAQRRYGLTTPEIEKALLLLTKSVYNPTRKQEGTTESIFCARPSWNAQKASSWASGEVYYNIKDVLSAAEYYVEVATKHPELLDQETFRYDLVDVVRQALSDCGRPLLAEANKNKDARASFLRIILATHLVLECSDSFRMDLREKDALVYGKSKAVKALRRMYTTWSGRGGKLNDYAHRQLSGLMKDYYYRRWKAFFDAANQQRVPSNQEYDLIDRSYLLRKIVIADKIENDDVLHRVRTSLRYVEEMHKKYPERFVTTSGIQWTLPAPRGLTTMSFSVSEYIQTAGTYEAEITWKAGRNAFAIQKVELYEGAKLVASDVHEGETGWQHVNNVYTLKIDAYRQSLDDYELRVTGWGKGGTDSRGTITIRKKK